jgi:hypothetical protein
VYLSFRKTNEYRIETDSKSTGRKGKESYFIHPSSRVIFSSYTQVASEVEHNRLTLFFLNVLERTDLLSDDQMMKVMMMMKARS